MYIVRCQKKTNSQTLLKGAKTSVV